MSAAPPPREKPSFWRSFPLFEDLPETVLADVAAVAVPQRWTAGTVIFQRGDAGEWLVALKSGRVRLSLITQGGRELTLRHAEPGDTLGELALFDQQPRSADATAVAETLGYVLARRDYDVLARTHPALTMGVARYLSRRLRETTEQLESIALYPLEARAARFLLFTLRQLNGHDLPARATLRLEISQTELATVLGASRPKVNRALQALADAGALIKGGDGWDCDIAALQTLAEPDAD
ncbi:Crp/Fnr family transcriptional regulator [Cypionkella sinensis]|uniref:Crp/Fnr family transcriptional regulator n=1 Tax=Cypionkella sinensis TaxID=1756043 RepID=A0ABV7J4Y9_9RHOB